MTQPVERPQSAWLARHALVGAAASAAVVFVPTGVAAGLAAMLAISIIAGMIGGIGRAGARARGLLWFFAGAVAARAVLALLAHYAISFGFFAIDNYLYSSVGWDLAQSWAGQGSPPEDLHGPTGYYRWNALLFTLFGYEPLVPALCNAALGGACVLLVFSLTREFADERAAMMAAALASFWPSLVLWESLNLKDTAAILSILWILRGLQRCNLRFDPVGLMQVAAGFAVLSQLREYLVWVAVAAAALGWTLPRLRAAPVLMVPMLGLVAAVLPVVAPLEELAVSVTLESLDETRREMAFGDSAYLSDADLSTAEGAIGFLPVGLAYFVLAPAPWQLLNARQLLTLPEMLAWYALIPFVVRGAVVALRTRFAAFLPIALFALFATISYALVEGNLGTAYRHRAQVIVLFLCMGAVGLTHPRRQRAATRVRMPMRAPGAMA